MNLNNIMQSLDELWKKKSEQTDMMLHCWESYILAERNIHCLRGPKFSAIPVDACVKIITTIRSTDSIQFNCSNGNEVTKTNVCDYKDDCGDNTDEQCCGELFV